MTAYEILHFAPVNPTDPAKVRALADSIAVNGWTGAPLLVSEPYGQMITGSHRLAALRLLDEEGDLDLDTLGDVAEDVTDLLADWCEATASTIDEIPFDDLGSIFAGTRIEDYKSELAEW